MAKYTLSDIFKGNFPVSQKFGSNPSYYAQFGLKGHEGVDWATPTGTPVLAPFDGVILRNDYQPDYKNYGKVIVIWSPVQKCAIWFCHLSEEYVSNGQLVKNGTIIGKTGNTGNSTGPHLHVGFVETDAAGNRLNTNNGYIGFVDILNPSLVNWVIGNVPIPNADKIVNEANTLAQQLTSKVDEVLKFGDPQGKQKLSNVRKMSEDIYKKL